MTGTTTLAENLKPGQRIHIHRHTVHGVTAGTAEADAEVDGIEIRGECEVAIDCHPCYLGAHRDERWVTTYHRTDTVVVIGGVAA